MNTIIDKIDLWSTAQTLKTSNRGLSASNQSLLGIKKLRELILELAVRGKLVSQDPNDEPASELLKKIEAEKRKLIKEGKIKKQEGLPEVGKDEKPFDLPKGWEWTRIRSVGHDWGQKTPDADFSYIEVSAIDNTKGEVKSPSILTASEAPSRARKIVKLGTVIYSTVRPYLKNICVIDQEYSPEPIASTAFAILHPYLKMSGRFFLFYLQSPVFVRYVESEQIGIAYPAINDRQFFGGLIPLPPLAEQHRIVTKVDELMALCDELEKQQVKSNVAHETLVATLLSTLTNAESPATFDESWQRIANHFDTLFTIEHTIDQLKQTILQLAVMGKLVPQDPKDKPAGELLKKIAKEKVQLVKEGKIKKQAPLPEITEDEKPFELPGGWEWVRFGELINIKSELVNSLDFPKLEQVAPDSIEKNTGKLLFRRTVAESGVRGPNNRFYKGQILYSKIRPSLSKAIIAPFDGICSADMYPLESMIDPEFLLKQILSEDFLKQVRIVENRIKMPKLNALTLSCIIVSLPPFAEQHRIVSKVDELFALCDDLKERINQAQTLQNQMAGAMVEQALN